MNTKGLALITVMGFILILSLLMVPLALGITQMTSSTNVVASRIYIEEARNSVVELVRYNITTSSTCQSTASSFEGLAQGSLAFAITCTRKVPAYSEDAYRYWDFTATYTPADTMRKPFSFTGSAVEYISTPRVVYITHVEDVKDGNKK
ncbi:hypothetical protein [Coprothermobacter platensis]|uniref:hypothetical protein n=1 Tax=Coprothermobacter platensis TaxID=108819 RepID=UPI00035E5A17|nr:hypothetical protein [Coprothermobacter platensis]